MTTVDVDAIRDAVASVPDPELPPVTVGMLGMIHEVSVDGGEVVVTLLPTFAGCPATEMIERDVREAVASVPGVEHIDVRFVYDPPWSSDRISAEGHDRLRDFGIAPPVGATHDVPDAVRRLPIAAAPTPCPYCASTDTAKESGFGPTPCRAIHYCNACRQPFEAFKHL
ncbi:MAG: phenylacetate-CoA oxygenase subunit PaaJ [Actinobacteria bacterium]|nr:phenylacetate-CoA oxygenase subunit PaaJ [Actinomycetota bacterium]